MTTFYLSKHIIYKEKLQECPYKGFTHKNKQIAVTKTICLFSCDSDIVNISTFTQPVANGQTI